MSDTPKIPGSTESPGGVTSPIGGRPDVRAPVTDEALLPATTDGAGRPPTGGKAWVARWELVEAAVGDRRGRHRPPCTPSRRGRTGKRGRQGRTRSEAERTPRQQFGHDYYLPQRRARLPSRPRPPRVFRSPRPPRPLPRRPRPPWLRPPRPPRPRPPQRRPPRRGGHTAVGNGCTLSVTQTPRAPLPSPSPRTWVPG